MNKFQNMMETIDVPAGLEQRVLAAAEARTAPRRTYKRVAFVALAVVLVVALAVGAWAIGRVQFVALDPHFDQVEYVLNENISAEEFLTTRVEGGLTVKLPTQLSSGFVYRPSIVLPLDATDENGGEVSFKLYGGYYVRGEEKVHLTFHRDVNQAISNPDFSPMTIGDVTVYYYDGTDQNPIRRENGEVVEWEEVVVRDLTWFDDGVSYALVASSEMGDTPIATLEDLIDMAAEIINN